MRPARAEAKRADRAHGRCRAGHGDADLLGATPLLDRDRFCRLHAMVQHDHETAGGV